MLDLCKEIYTKRILGLKIADASLSVRQTGQISVSLQLVYLFDNIGVNRIGRQGCIFLAKANWPKIS